MSKYLAIFIAMSFLVACGGPNETPNLCETANCGTHGTCKDTGNCNCQSNWYGDECNLHLDVTQYMAHKVFCETDSGKLEISGVTGSESYLNGYYIDVPAGAVDRCAIFLLSPAIGTNLPSPDSDRLVPQAHGLEVVAIDKENPFRPDGSLNKLQPLEKISIHFANHRGRVLLFESNSFTILPTELLSTGVLAKVSHLSPIYLLDAKPTISATVTDLENGEVELDFTGTEDEGFLQAFFLTFLAQENGANIALTAVEPYKFKATLTGGSHTIKAIVEDPYGNKSSADISLTVDLCSSVTCDPYETCREVDGQCVGDDPCSPNPCKNGGSCDNSTGSAVCTCVPPYGGATCTNQNLCYQKTCSGHGTCQSSTGNCQCDTGYTGTTCNACDTGYTGYPTCVVNPCYGITCSGHGTCSGGTCTCNQFFAGASCNQCAVGTIGTYPNCTKNPCDGVNCSGHGTCSGGTCTCDQYFAGTSCNQCAVGTIGTYPNCTKNPCDGVNCSGHGTCSGGTCTCNQFFAGASCNTCDIGTVGTYPNCVDDPCDPDPCNGHGSCSGGTCTCSSLFTGASCDQCAVGTIGTYPNCVNDPCYGITCNGHGTCSGGTCTCKTGYIGNTCNACDTGYIGYPNCVADPCYGVSCNGYGTCSGGTCNCNTGYDSAKNCGDCLGTYEGYPTCVPDVTPPADPVITTGGGENFNIHQDNFTIQGTCASDTYTMWIKIDTGTPFQLTGYSAGSTTWTYNGNNPTVFTGHDYCFSAKDQAGNTSGEDCIHIARVP